MECEQNHEDCPKAGIPQLPTRVLDIGTESTGIKLVNSEGGFGRYVALSHCWGPPTNPPIKTLFNNIKERLQGIDFHDLTKVFQDATVLTRLLGIRYIWIDALCIIQDSKEDVCISPQYLLPILGNIQTAETRLYSQGISHSS